MQSEDTVSSHDGLYLNVSDLLLYIPPAVFWLTQQLRVNRKAGFRDKVGHCGSRVRGCERQDPWKKAKRKERDCMEKLSQPNAMDE